MAFLSVFVVLLVAGYSYSASVTNRVAGGELNTIDHYTSLVQVDYFNTNTDTWSQTCAGSILTSVHMLSAAHCFIGKNYSPLYRRVRAGSSYRNTGGQVVGVFGTIIHPTYGKIGQDGDIAIVQLAEPLVYNSEVQQGVIITQGFEFPDNIPVIHAGWGNSEEGAEQSEQLRDVTIYTVNPQLCRDRYAEIGLQVTDNMLCAGVINVGGKDACQGDTGGPLYYDNILVGIVSWNHGCGNPTYPGVSTKLSAYTDWIIENTS